MRIGPTEEVNARRIAAEVLEVADSGFKVRQSVLGEDGEQEGPAKIRVSDWQDVLDPYAMLSPEVTKVGEGSLEVAGRLWKATIYHKAEVVDHQEQELTIWTATEVPGLALKMTFRGPRRTTEMSLESFEEGVDAEEPQTKRED